MQSLQISRSSVPAGAMTGMASTLNVKGSVSGQIRSLTAAEADQLQIVSYGKILTWEGLVENVGQPTAQVHLIDTTRFDGHYGYTRDALGRGAAYTQDTFFSEVQLPERRKYMPFFVFDFRDRPLTWKGKTYQWVLNIRRYNYADSDQALANMLVELRELLSDRLIPDAGEPLLFVYHKANTFRRPHINQLAEVQAAGFQTITEPEMIRSAGGELVSVLNPGEAIGYLHLIRADDEMEGLTPRHIAIFEDTPERIPPVTGIVTLEPQTPLSHVNLLAKNRGTPNVSTANIRLVPGLEQLIDQLVRMVARQDGTVRFEPVSLQEAERFWQSRQPDELAVPTITAESLDPVVFATGKKEEKAIANIGAKAANYAEIERLLGSELVKPGAALSFAHYLRVVAEPQTAALIQDLLEQKAQLSPEAINERLGQIREQIRKGTGEDAIAPTISAVRAIITQLPSDVTRIRLRSSTNSEDLPTFNGAGLYESKGFNIDDSDKKLRKKLLTVMASLWLERAFWERELFGIDHSKVGMAILINPAFSDEYANGVVIGSQEPQGFRTWVNAQKGEASVTNPLDNELSESFTFFDQAVRAVTIQSQSNIGSVFLHESETRVSEQFVSLLTQMKRATQKLYDHFVAKQREQGDQRKYGIDLEYKLMTEGDQVKLYIKQSRLLNLDHEAAVPNSSISKAVAKDNGMQGAHLRRWPRQLSALRADEFCVLKTDQVVGVNAYEEVGNGFVRLNVVIPSSACPGFVGTVYAFKKHFNFI